MFSAVKLNKNADIDNFTYSGEGIGFDRRGIFSVPGGFCRNVVKFGVNMNSFLPVYNKNLVEGPRQGKKFCLSLH